MTKRERKEFIKTTEYMERVEKLREHRIFGDTFDASSGFNLHDVDSWSPAMKRKITRYYRVMAPKYAAGQITQVYRPRRADHLEAARRASLQEEKLPGQKAILFTLPSRRQKLSVKFRADGSAVTERAGISQRSLLFDKNAFIADWKKELDRVLGETDAKVFKYIAGGNVSADTFTRNNIEDILLNLIETYTEEAALSTDFTQRFFGEWLNGLVAYEGVTMMKMRSQDKVRKKQVNERRVLRAKERAKHRRAFTATELKKLKRGELTKGRRGRIR